MQYLVSVCGEISDKQNKTYVINTDSVDKAEKIALQNFRKEFSVNSCGILSTPYERTKKAILSFALMIVPIILSLINWKYGHNTISIAPDYISCLYAILIYGAFIVRFKGVKRTVSSYIDVLFCVFVILLLSTFIRTLMVTKTIAFPGLDSITVNTGIVIPVIVVLSWLGLKIVSLTLMIFVALVALFNVISLNEAMGNFWGSVYIICATLGLMLYLSVEPAFEESMVAIKMLSVNGLKYINKDMIEAKNRVVSISSDISKKRDKKKRTQEDEK